MSQCFIERSSTKLQISGEAILDYITMCVCMDRKL